MALSEVWGVPATPGWTVNVAVLVVVANLWSWESQLSMRRFLVEMVPVRECLKGFVLATYMFFKIQLDFLGSQ